MANMKQDHQKVTMFPIIYSVQYSVILQGTCTREARCRFRHVNAMQYDMEMNTYQVPSLYQVLYCPLYQIHGYLSTNHFVHFRLTEGVSTRVTEGTGGTTRMTASTRGGEGRPREGKLLPLFLPLHLLLQVPD